MLWFWQQEFERHRGHGEHGNMAAKLPSTSDCGQRDNSHANHTFEKLNYSGPQALIESVTLTNRMAIQHYADSC
jgi:hypothetical protein